MKQQKIKVYRTKEGTAFELVFLLFAILLWGYIAWLASHAPEVVPTHFGINGQPDAYGSPLEILLPCIITTVLGICMMAGAYFPHTVNLPVKLNSPRQYALVVRMMRVLGLLMLLLTLSIAFSALHQGSHGALLVLASVALMLIVIAVFIFLITKLQ